MGGTEGGHRSTRILSGLRFTLPDHSMEYGRFEGTLPEGNYSAGEVRIWDKGESRTDDEPKKQKRKDQV